MPPHVTCHESENEVLRAMAIENELCAQAFDDIAGFGRWPLLPTAHGELAAVRDLHQSRLMWLPDEDDWEPAAVSALLKLGLRYASPGVPCI